MMINLLYLYCKEFVSNTLYSMLQVDKRSHTENDNYYRTVHYYTDRLVFSPLISEPIPLQIPLAYG